MGQVKLLVYKIEACKQEVYGIGITPKIFLYHQLWENKHNNLIKY